MPDEASPQTMTAESAERLVKPKILFLAPRALVRDCVSALLSRLAPDFDVTCGTDLSECLFDGAALVVVWDDSISAEDGTSLLGEAARYAQALPHVRFLALVSQTGAAARLHPPSANMALLCIETATPEIAGAAIGLVLAGETFISSRLLIGSEDAARENGQAPARNPIGVTGASLSGKGNGFGARAIMTRRELELLERVDRGEQNKVIAYELGISESTVKVHLRNLMRKLNATNRTQVAFIARQMDAGH